MTAIAHKHAVITGGGSGIGASCAQALAEAGARITLMGRDLARLETQRDAMRAHGDVACVSVDVTNPPSQKRSRASVPSISSSTTRAMRKPRPSRIPTPRSGNACST
jgi:NADP-dependent 3-hydroxy acid dehydrogenase YdfG